MTFDPFSAISTARPNGGGNYILTGQHILQIRECKRIDSPHKGTTNFVATMEVIESDNDQMKTGSERSAVFTLKHAPQVSNLRSFLAAAMDKDFDDVDESDAHKAVAKDQPLAGVTLFCEAFPFRTQKGVDITKYAWNQVPDAK
jgi:hypothetical protein